MYSHGPHLELLLETTHGLHNLLQVVVIDALLKVLDNCRHVLKDPGGPQNRVKDKQRTSAFRQSDHRQFISSYLSHGLHLGLRVKP